MSIIQKTVYETWDIYGCNLMTWVTKENLDSACSLSTEEDKSPSLSSSFSHSSSAFHVSVAHKPATQATFAAGEFKLFLYVHAWNSLLTEMWLWVKQKSPRTTQKVVVLLKHNDLRHQIVQAWK